MSSFNTIELSDEPYENDGLRFLTVKTKNLKGRGDICIFIPEVEESTTSLPIYILLHGVYGSAWVWAMKGGAHRTAQKLMENGQIKPAIIAMPSDGLWGDGSGYLSHVEKNFAQWIVHDVPTAVRENIKCADKNSPLCIGGLSMGGYGALLLGVQYPEKFKAISVHSAITLFSGLAAFVEEPLEAYNLRDTEKDVIVAIKSQLGNLPPIRFDCGLEDNLLAANRLLQQQLISLGVEHTYEEFEGGHEWSYWQKHIARSFLYFNAHL